MTGRCRIDGSDVYNDTSPGSPDTLMHAPTRRQKATFYP